MKSNLGANGQAVEILEIGGRSVEVDIEIANLVRLLNDGGFPTKASCSGHGFRPADIALSDGREIIIARNYEEARFINSLFPLNINGDPTGNDLLAAMQTAIRLGRAYASGTGTQFESGMAEAEAAIAIAMEARSGETEALRDARKMANNHRHLGSMGALDRVCRILDATLNEDTNHVER